MCYDEAMDEFYMSTGHGRFVDCRKLNQAEGKAEAIAKLLGEIEAAPTRKNNILACCTSPNRAHVF